MHACGNQTGNVGHIHHEHGAVAVGDFGDLLEVDGPGIGGGSHHQQLGPDLGHLLLERVIVNEAVHVHAVGKEVIVPAGHVGGAAVGQMSAVAQVHAEDRVAQIQKTKIYRQIRLGAAVGLDVGVFGAEEPAGPVDGDLLHLIHIDASAVIALAGIAFGIFVGEDTAHGGHDRRGDDVLTGNQFNVLTLPGQLPAHGRADLRILEGYRADCVKHGFVHWLQSPLFRRKISIAQPVLWRKTNVRF